MAEFCTIKGAPTGADDKPGFAAGTEVDAPTEADAVLVLVPALDLLPRAPTGIDVEWTLGRPSGNGENKLSPVSGKETVGESAGMRQSSSYSAGAVGSEHHPSPVEQCQACHTSGPDA